MADEPTAPRAWKGLERFRFPAMGEGIAVAASAKSSTARLESAPAVRAGFSWAGAWMSYLPEAGHSSIDNHVTAPTKNGNVRAKIVQGVSVAVMTVKAGPSALLASAKRERFLGPLVSRTTASLISAPRRIA